MAKSEMVEVFAEVKGETDKALKLTDGQKVQWVPKSQIKEIAEGLYSMPVWLAEKKGFI
jgi:hypothetical protein